MKIGIVSNLYPPQARGGAELVAQRVADALYARGHDVFVLTSKPFGGIRSLFATIHERHLGPVYRFFPLNLYHLRNDHSVPFPIRAMWHLIDLFNPFARSVMKRLIDREEPDVFISHNLKGVGVSVGKAIQDSGVPHIHTLHDVQLSVPSGLLIHGCENNFLNRSFLRRWYENAVTRNIGTPDVVVSPSKFLAEFYRDRGMFKNSRIEILPNPLPPIVTMPRDRRIPGPTRFLFVGQLEKHKGIMQLFDALDTLEGVELRIAGEGSLAEFVAERAKRDKRVHYLGFVSLKYLMQLLKHSDAVIVPSLCYENSPTVIYESFQVGVPVIASAIGGIPELIEHGETGWLVEPGNIEDLASAMRRAHEKMDSWWSMTSKIREQAEQYSIKRYVDRIEELIDQIT